MSGAYFQCVITDGGELSGPSVHSVLKQLLNIDSASGPTIAVLRGFVGAGLGELGDECDKALFLLVPELLERIKQVAQIDWGDLFFCADQSAALRVAGLDDAKASIMESVFLVRFVDDAYLYVYTKDPALIEQLQAQFPNAEHKRGRLDDLDFPA